MALKLVDLPDAREMQKNILYVWSTASPEDMAEGMSWYKDAFTYCENLGIEYQIPTERVVALVSVISPGLIWGGNITIPEQVIDLWKRGVPVDEWTGFQCWPKNIEKAKAILDGDMSVMRGPKVESFFANIMGDTEPVTIDRWSIRVAFDNPKIAGSQAPSGKATYNALADAYRAVAAIVGVDACDLQAVTWTVYRYMYNGRARKQREEVRKLVKA